MSETTATEEYFDPLIGYEPPAKESAAVFGAQPSYDAANDFAREFTTWQPSLMSVDTEVIPEKGTIDSRVRDAMRNDAYVSGGMTLQQNSIVGERFLLNSKPNFRVLGLDDVWAEEFQEEVEAKFTLFAESDRNFPDAGRRNTLTGLVRLAVGAFTYGGEVLATAEWLRNQGRPFSSALQMVEVDRLCNPYGEMDTPALRGGVQLNQWGAPVGYHIRRAHPTDYMNPDSYVWQYVPLTRGQAVGIPGWDRLQVIHIIDQTRPSQTRAVGRIVAALKETRMGKRFRDTVLQNAVLNATYAASIESDMPAEIAMAAAGGSDPEMFTRYATAFLGEVAKFTRGGRNLHIDGVKVPVFYPGTKMKMQPAGTPGGVGSEFENSLLRYLSAALPGTTFEQISKNYAQANYSNLRAAITDAGRANRVSKRICADRFATAYFRLWLEEALSIGEITSMPRNAPNWYEGMNSDAYCACEWIGASMGQIDELKETQAALLRINNGLSTLEDEHARLGKDWRTVLPQIAREQAMIKKLGLELGADKTSQNTANAASGTPSNGGNAPRSADKEEETDE